jgi:acetyltransferase-like isoleucine patch superfamily enzyme
MKVSPGTVLREMAAFFGQFVLQLVRGNDSKIAAVLRKKLYRTPCAIDTHVFIRNGRHFTAGRDSALYHGCYILNGNGRFILGDHSHLGAFCYVNVHYGQIVIGDDVAIGPGTKLIAYSNHYKAGRKVTEERVTKDIVIKNNVFIGANCTILPGTIIHDHVVVGAGSVVKGELESNSVYAGVPCKKISSGWYV